MDSRGLDRRCFEAGASCDPAAQEICCPRAKSRAASNSLVARLVSRYGQALLEQSVRRFMVVVVVVVLVLVVENRL